MQRLVALGVLSMLGTGCPRVVPGDLLGSFEITGRLEENTCGMSAVPAKDPLLFVAELRSNHGVPHWKLPEAPMIQGSSPVENEYRFYRESAVAVLPAGKQTKETPIFGIPELGIETTVDYPGCAFRQVEQIEIVLTPLPAHDAGADAGPDGGRDAEVSADGGLAAMALAGTSTVAFYPVAGGDCTPVEAENGGPFLEFPCSIIYSLEGQSSE